MIADQGLELPSAHPRTHASSLPALRRLAPMLLLAALMSAGALYNRFPLIFPDSGAYLSVAFGHDYAIDRSSFYGFLLKPVLANVPGMAGLWLALGLQLVAIAAILLAVARAALGTARVPWLAVTALLLFTPLPWQAAQFMPDALTAPMVLVAWLAARRDPGEDGAVLLWIAALLMAVTHYTHVVLLCVTLASVIAAEMLTGLRGRALLRRIGAALAVVACAFGLTIATNGAVLGQWKTAPLGSAFLFSRLNQDGLIQPWLDDHCGRDAPGALCAARDHMPIDSQIMLWGDGNSIVGKHIWNAATPDERWDWANMMGDAAHGAILARPFHFARTSAIGAARQMLHFQTADDGCPCGDPHSGVGFAFTTGRPDALPVYLRSRQAETGLPATAIRIATTPLSALTLILLPVGLAVAWRRRDGAMLGLIGATTMTLLCNAALTGALSDVHDRYQSRLIWLAPLVLGLAALRWRRERLSGSPSLAGIASSPRTAA